LWLQRDRTLAEYKVHEGSHIHAVPRKTFPKHGYFCSAKIRQAAEKEATRNERVGKRDSEEAVMEQKGESAKVQRENGTEKADKGEAECDDPGAAENDKASPRPQVGAGERRGYGAGDDLRRFQEQVDDMGAPDDESSQLITSEGPHTEQVSTTEPSGDDKFNETGENKEDEDPNFPGANGV